MQDGPLRNALKSNSAHVLENAKLQKRITELEADYRRMREAMRTALDLIETSYSAEAIKTLRAALSQEKP